MAEPALANAELVRRALSARGIAVTGPTGYATMPATGAAVATLPSATIAELVRDMLQRSDNQIADLLLKEVGFATVGLGSLPNGAAATAEALSSLCVPLYGRVDDGSGLSRGNVRSAREWRTILQAARDEAWWPAFADGLPVAGRTGTLAGRFRGTAAEGNVRAKTGTIIGGSALVGLRHDGQWSALRVLGGGERPRRRAQRRRDRRARRRRRRARRLSLREPCPLYPGVMGGNVRWMFHATAMGPSYRAIFDPLEHLFGCRVLHYQDADAPGVERRGGMTWLADNSIEIGEPYGASPAIRGFIERFGGGMHSVAVQVDDTEATMARVAPLGVEVGARISDEIVFTRPGATAGLLVEWASHVQDDDPRWGAPEPPFVRPPVVVVQQMAFVGALAADPVADARRLGEVLDTVVTVLDPTAPADVPHATVDLADCVLALYPLPSPQQSDAIWGTVQTRPRCLALGLTVADLATAEAALGAEGVEVRRRTSDGALVLDTAQLPFPVVLTDRLLRGDPRLAP